MARLGNSGCVPPGGNSCGALLISAHLGGEQPGVKKLYWPTLAEATSLRRGAFLSCSNVAQDHFVAWSSFEFRWAATRPTMARRQSSTTVPRSNQGST